MSRCVRVVWRRVCGPTSCLCTCVWVPRPLCTLRRLWRRYRHTCALPGCYSVLCGVPYCMLDYNAVARTRQIITSQMPFRSHLTFPPPDLWCRCAGRYHHTRALRNVPSSRWLYLCAIYPLHVHFASFGAIIAVTGRSECLPRQTGFPSSRHVQSCRSRSTQ